MKKQLVSLIALINQENEVLISRRNRNKEYEGFWEYPGGKVEKDESTYNASDREVREELGITLQENCNAPLAFSTERTQKETILLLFTSRNGMVTLKQERTKY